MSNTAAKQFGSRGRAGLPSLATVYDGQTCIGFLLKRANSVEAFDADEHSLGIFPDIKTAADAVSRAMGDGA